MGELALYTARAVIIRIGIIKVMHYLFLMSCNQLHCVAVGFVRGERHKAIVELLKAQVECASSLSQKNIEELSLLFISIRNMLVFRGHHGV